MSEPIPSPATGDAAPDEPGDMLQFDRAEFATPAAERPTCSVCHQPIPEEYFEVNGKVMCPRCRQGVEAAIRGGSPAVRFLKAAIFGSVAAAVGSVIYYASIRLTHANWALVSILVGFLIGTAVRKGTGNRGGAIYQALAVFLTYTCIAVMWVLPLMEVIARSVSSPQMLAQWLGLIYKIPIMEATESPISGLIYAFALWEAWKINKPIQLVFNGPFRLSAAAPAEARPEVADAT